LVPFKPFGKKKEEKNFVVSGQYDTAGSDCSPPSSLSIRLFQQQIIKQFFPASALCVQDIKYRRISFADQSLWKKFKDAKLIYQLQKNHNINIWKIHKCLLHSRKIYKLLYFILDKCKNLDKKNNLIRF
jgi:hypothetical protein